VLAHCGGNELFEDVFNVLAGKNIYFDTAFILDYINKETFINILEKHGEDKILFATDSPWRDIKKDVEIVKSLNLKKEVEDKIFYKNALRLLKGIEL
jgi:predicted TIM-barrel fold metal-dependent hydrolase